MTPTIARVEIIAITTRIAIIMPVEGGTEGERKRGRERRRGREGEGGREGGREEGQGGEGERNMYANIMYATSLPWDNSRYKLFIHIT